MTERRADGMEVRCQIACSLLGNYLIIRLLSKLIPSYRHLDTVCCVVAKEKKKKALASHSRYCVGRFLLYGKAGWHNEKPRRQTRMVPRTRSVTGESYSTSVCFSFFIYPMKTCNCIHHKLLVRIK